MNSADFSTVNRVKANILNNTRCEYQYDVLISHELYYYLISY